MKTAGTVLLLTNSADATSDYLEDGVTTAGISVSRYNTDVDLHDTHFSYHRSSMVMRWGSVKLRPENISHVIFRRPKPFHPHIRGDNFQVQHAGDEWSEVWEGFLSAVPHEFWINHPSRNFAASHKIEQISRANKFGLNTPQTLVTSIPDLALDFCRQYPRVIVKPLSSGYIERDNPVNDTLIYTRAFEQKDIKVIDRVKLCPVMFQERIDKLIDVRITFLDGRMIAVGLKASDENEDQRLDIRRFNMSDVEYENVDLPKDVREKIKSLIKSYKIRFAAIDFAIDSNGNWVFLK